MNTEQHEVEKIPAAYLRGVKAESKRRGINFDVDRDYLQNLLARQGQRCYLTGRPITFYRLEGAEFTDWFSASASLDRIDSSEGYCPGNVRWVNKIANLMKGVLSDEEFFRICEAVIARKNGLQTPPPAHFLPDAIAKKKPTSLRIAGCRSDLEFRPQKLKEDKTGYVYGKISVLQYAGHDLGSGLSHWICECECGQVFTTKAGSLMHGSRTSCGCSVGKTGQENLNWKGSGVVSGQKMSRIREKARRRGLEFSIDAKYLSDLFVQQGGRCAMTGWPIALSVGKRTAATETASLDRINSELGYVEKNVVWLHKKLNMMKWHFSQPTVENVMTDVFANWYWLREANKGLVENPLTPRWVGDYQDQDLWDSLRQAAEARWAGF